MGKLTNMYDAIWEDLPNKTGLLLIYASEKKFPGSYFIKFSVEENDFNIKTSCGSLIFTENTVQLTTFNGSKYKFEILEDLIESFFEKGHV